MAKIPAELYKQIMENVPICTVDFAVLHKGKVLLALRNDDPEKGKWWVQGGRILKNEKLGDAVRRKAREEIGCDVKIIRRVGTYEFFSDRAVFADITTGIHNIAVFYLVTPESPDAEIQLARDHSQYRWIDHIERGLAPYVRNALLDARVFLGEQGVYEKGNK